MKSVNLSPYIKIVTHIIRLQKCASHNTENTRADRRTVVLAVLVLHV